MEQQLKVAASEEPDCHCGHSYYDHIGWRMVNGEYDRSNCRIVRCGCECYTEASGRALEYKVSFGPPLAGSAFNPSSIYGNAIHYLGTYTAIPQLTKDILHKEARHILPPRQYYELRGTIPQNYGGNKELCWIYTPDMARPGKMWFPDLNPPELDLALNCYIIGGYVT